MKRRRHNRPSSFCKSFPIPFFRLLQVLTPYPSLIFLVIELSFTPQIYLLLHSRFILSLFLSPAAYKLFSVIFYTLTTLSSYHLKGSIACPECPSQISIYRLHTTA
jgi:hypothetical protein